jgi:hypothetical protein
MDSYRLGDDLESSVSMHSVNGKSAAVQREHPLGFKLFRQNSQRGVREIGTFRYLSIRTATRWRLLVEEGTN